MSRLPLPKGGAECPSEMRMCNIQQFEMLHLTSQEIQRATRRDPILQKVLSYCMRGWPSSVGKSLRVYHTKMAELSVEDGCLLWGGRVIIPVSLKKVVLSELHKEHMGVSRMKALARSHVWWHGLDQDIEALAKSCQACLAVKQSPAKAPLHPWTWPSRPWQRLHVDFAGPFLNQSYFIVVDAHSKWAEVVEMTKTTTAKTITALRHLFAVHGIPEQIVSDNGPQFVSSDFEEFTRGNGIRHTRSSPYHPASNGEAERFVRTFKEAMKVGKSDGLSLSHRLDNFLLTYRTTPHTTTGSPPCELLMGRSLRTRWDFLKPDVGRRVRRSQWKQQERQNHARLRVLEVGQSVVAKNFRSGPAWIPGVIVEQLGPVTYLVDVSDGRMWKRHVDHVKEYMPQCPSPESDDMENDVSFPTSSQIPAPETVILPQDSGSGEVVDPAPDMIPLAAEGSPPSLSRTFDHPSSSLPRTSDHPSSSLPRTFDHPSSSTPIVGTPPSVTRKLYPGRSRSRPEYFHDQKW